MMDLPGGNGSDYKDYYDSDYKDDKNSSFYNSIDVILFLVYCLVFVLGVPGNGAVVWVTGFRLKKTTNTVWFLNLAAADLLFAAFLPLTVTNMAMGGHWPFGRFLCKLNYSVSFLTMYASVYVLVVISVDRCVSAVWPAWAQSHHSVRKASYVSLGVWALSAALSTPEFIYTDSLMADNITECWNNFMLEESLSESPAVARLRHLRVWGVTLTRLLLGFVVPFAVVVSCYAVIRGRKGSPASGGLSGRHPLKITAAVVTAYFLCWAPYHVMEVIPKYSISETVVFFIAVCLSILHRCLNPLLYIFMGQDFKGKGRKPVLKVLESVFTEEEPRPINPPTNFNLSDAE